MPIYAPNNMQGDYSLNSVGIMAGDIPSVILEWGHFFDPTPSLLVAQGGAFALRWWLLVIFSV